MKAPLCEKLGIEVPILLAAMGGCTNARFAAAVGDAGGFGTIGQRYDATAREIAHTKALNDRPFGVGVILDLDVEGEVRAILENPPAVVWAFSGVGPLAKAAHAAGAQLWALVGNVDEGRQAVDAGADVVIANGLDAGGHVRGTTDTLSLRPQLVEAPGDIPVVAAGVSGDVEDAPLWAGQGVGRVNRVQPAAAIVADIAAGAPAALEGNAR